MRDPHDQNVFHLFAELMVGHCPLTQWVNSSTIVHATSDSPLGPFRVRSTALPAFHHNVGVALTPNGTWLMYMTGCDVWPDTLKQCTANSIDREAGFLRRPPMPAGCTGMTPVSPATHAIYSKYSLDGRIRLATSVSPDGPCETGCSDLAWGGPKRGPRVLADSRSTQHRCAHTTCSDCY